jgi:hypothetical protein
MAEACEAEQQSRPGQSSFQQFTLAVGERSEQPDGEPGQELPCATCSANDSPASKPIGTGRVAVVAAVPAAGLLELQPTRLPLQDTRTLRLPRQKPS